jgi:hypothetical protein
LPVKPEEEEEHEEEETTGSPPRWKAGERQARRLLGGMQ